MSDEPKAPETPEEPAKPQWEYKTEFGINTKLRDIVHKAIDASSAEIVSLKRKLDRLTYGS